MQCMGERCDMESFLVCLADIDPLPPLGRLYTVPELYNLGNPAKDGSGIHALKVGDTMNKKEQHFARLAETGRSISPSVRASPYP